ncbi:lysophospholipase [Bacillus sp. OVS6]|nr:lysophospholipase [Bacillus sp. OVS6]
MKSPCYSKTKYGKIRKNSIKDSETVEDLQFIHKNGNKNLILFIHGFKSDSKTWVNKNGESFPNLLKMSTEISANFDIATFDYYTKLADFYSLKVIKTGILRLIGKEGVLSLKNLSITKLGDYLRTVVDINCDNYENIIIIAHSMGGLVAKSYILKGINASSSKVKMFFSLAVPHCGSDWATYGKMLFRDHDQLIDLHPLNERVHKLNNEWIQTKNELPKTLYFLVLTIML